MSDDPVVMLACYRVAAANFQSFLRLLNDTEDVYRAEDAITDAPVVRLQSIEDPTFVVELIEWRSPTALAAVQDNDAIQAKWSAIKEAWLDGDFPLSRVPEASVPWSVMRPIRRD
jgi:hypothetical protein